MKELNGIDATQAIIAEVPGTKVLMLSMHSAEEFVRRSIKAGASGYVAKDSVPLELRMAIEALMRGEMYLSSRVSQGRGYRLAVSASTNSRAVSISSNLDRIASSFTIRARVPTQIK